MLITEDHWGEGIERSPTPFTSGNISPKYVCLYGMVGVFENILDMFCNYDSIKESTHLIISEEGDIVQLAPFDVKTWHAGSSYYQGYHGLNGFAIGIHLISSNGEITRSHDIALLSVLPDIVARYNIRDIISIPRPHTHLIDLRGFKQYAQYGNADSEGRFICIGDIVVYAGPSTDFDALDRLKTGEAVKVLRYSKDKEWAFVLFERKDHVMKLGWTHESFLKRL